ncbi:hypothetical protein [Microvirga alba]|uniref:Uncharacterized protein n=1 Tax=Microvirga alba TaxID=2791025 RepID=A0A931BSX3_9HYPH|nr:hypothetical protein [Microvirga alba]MBF9235119.1 hypothetical protein [Microvirga alba]
MNAARIGRERLEQAFVDTGEAGVPNACGTCPARGPCADAFGATEEGYSLYPFTESALNTMALRTNPEAATRFNPRTFQKYVLRPVLVDEASALAAGEFPTAALLNRMGGSNFRPDERARLMDKAGPRFDRYLSLFQLWSDGRLENPPEGVMPAFGLEPLAGLDVRPPPPPPGPDPLPPQPTPRDPVSVQLAVWVEGGDMDQSLAQRLRQALFPIIERAIDWDTLGLVPTSFAGATATTARPFRNASIAFARQVTTGGAVPPIRLELPFQQDDQGFTKAAFALETLLKIEKSGWSAGGGIAGLAALSELVEVCAADVVRQVQGLRGNTKKWDPIAGVVELLLVGSALGGALIPTQAQTDEGLLESLFKDVPQESPSTTTELRSVYASLRQKRSALQDLLRAHISVTKGGRAGRFINPVVPLAAARLLRRRNWKLDRHPEALPDPYKVVGDLYEAVQGKLHAALLMERDERTRWLDEVEQGLGFEPTRQSVLEGVRRALDAAALGGLPGPRAPLEAARDEFANVHFVAALEAARRIRDADPPEGELPSFARAHRNAIEATQNLIRRWADFLAMAEAEVRARRADSASVEVERETTRLNAVLGALVQDLSELEPGGTSRDAA